MNGYGSHAAPASELATVMVLLCGWSSCVAAAEPPTDSPREVHGRHGSELGRQHGLCSDHSPIAGPPGGGVRRTEGRTFHFGHFPGQTSLMLGHRCHWTQSLPNFMTI